jgi:hypothetical protein
MPYRAVTQMGHHPETCKRYPKRAAAVALPDPGAPPVLRVEQRAQQPGGLDVAIPV